METTSPRAPRPPAPPPPARAVADRLHSAAIHLLRRLRVEDKAMGLSGPRTSALSVIVFRGPVTMSALAEAEQVRRPTMTRLVDGLERRGVVGRGGAAPGGGGGGGGGTGGGGGRPYTGGAAGAAAALRATPHL